MQSILLMMSMMWMQHAPVPVSAASSVVSSDGPVRVEVLISCFRSDVEISKEQRLNVDQFLSDPKVQSQKLWSNEFSSSTLAGSELSISLGENRSLVSGMNVGANGRTTPTLVRQQVGTILKVIPKLTDDGRIQAKLSIEASQADNVDPDAELAEQMMQTGITELQHNSSISTTSGQAEVIVLTQDDASNPKKSRTYVIVVKLTTLE